MAPAGAASPLHRRRTRPPRLPESQLIEGCCYVRVADDRVPDLAALDFVCVRETDVCRQVAAPALAVPARVADHPRIGIDVLVDLCPELVVGCGPMSYNAADALPTPEHLRYVRRGLHVTELNFDVGVIQLE